MCAIDVRTPLAYKLDPASGPFGPPHHLGSAASTMKNFDDLLASVRQATARAAQPRRSARQPEINALTVKRLRRWTGLSQADFAWLLGVELSTLRNWEQGRREPTGPARALLRAISNDPEHVLIALRSSGARRAPVLRRREAAA